MYFHGSKHVFSERKHCGSWWDGIVRSQLIWINSVFKKDESWFSRTRIKNLRSIKKPFQIGNHQTALSSNRFVWIHVKEIYLKRLWNFWYLFQQIRGINIESATSFNDMFSSIFTLVFIHDVTAEKHGDHLTSWKPLLICLKYIIAAYSKPVLSGHSKRRPKIGIQDRLSLNECRKYCRMLSWSILQYFWPALSYHLSLRSLFCLFLCSRLRQVLLYVLKFQKVGFQAWFTKGLSE